MSVKILIDLGSDVNAEVIQGKFAFFCGGTALPTAIHGNNAAVVKVLLANKADANIGDKHGNTGLHSFTSKQIFMTLHISTNAEFSDISRLLIDSGCSTNLKNWEGKTPLDVKPFSPRFGESPEVKASKVYASQKNPLDEILDENKDEDKDVAWLKLRTVSSSAVGKLKEQRTKRNLVFPFKKLRELSSR